jgi:hypothetical protein
MTRKIPRAQDCLATCPLWPAATSSTMADMAVLHAWASREVDLGNVIGSDIEAAELSNSMEPEKGAFNRLHELLQSLLTPEMIAVQQEEGLHLSPELLYCRWAAPHTDNMFDKELFVSLVLGTGPGPYRLESLVPTIKEHPDGRRSPRLDFERCRIELKAGDVFVFDPLVPHYASPENPHQQSLLSLLQVRLPYRNARERGRWLRQLTACRPSQKITRKT